MSPADQLDTQAAFGVLSSAAGMLRITRSELNRLRSHGEKSYPHECCGILLGSVVGDQRTVTCALPCANSRAERQTDRYEIDPRELIAAQKQAREQGLDIVGFYHSHPDHPAQWSVTDLKEAHWMGCCYVITEVRSGVAQQTRAFALRGDSEEQKHFDEESIETK